MFLQFLVLFLTIYFLGSPVGIATFWGHLSVVVISFFYLKPLTSTILFWFVLLITFLSAQEPRFSLEYVIMAMTLFCVGLDDLWNKNEKIFENKREKIILGIFILLTIISLLKYDFSERGSLLLWLPVFVALYYRPVNKSNWLFYLVLGSSLFCLNKLGAFLAFLVSLRSRVLYLISVFILAVYFCIKQDLSKFFFKSIEPRLYILKSIWVGFLHKPLFGHGFGTFALDFPPYRSHADVLGGRISEQVVHGHSLFGHFMFEGGIWGLLLIAVLFYLVYINVPRVFLPLLIICICDSPLVTFNQYFLAGLIMIPHIRNFGIFKFLFARISNRFLSNVSCVIGILVCVLIYLPSLIGHYYYDSGNLDKAIKWDGKNSLYYFTRGANSLSKNTMQSERDFLKAVSLTPSVSYFYGFLGASKLANNKISEARKNLEIAMKLDGDDGYWCLLYSYANFEDKKIYKKYKRKAIKKNPEILKLLSRSNLSAPRYIGYSRKGDVRLAGFYRKGEKIYFPLLIIDH